MNFITETERIYSTDPNGKLLAEITFPLIDGTAIINHTFVDNSLRGMGIASEVMQLAVDKIIADGNRIMATCPYAVSWLEKHPEYQSEF